MSFINNIIDFILIVGFFAVLVWALIEYLPAIREIISILIP
jgi:hypothetical protein